MLYLHNLLLPLSFTPAEVARLAQALDIQKRTGAVLHLAYQSPASPQAEQTALSRDAVLAKMQAFFAQHNLPYADKKVRLADGLLHGTRTQLLSYAEQHRIDLVLVGANRAVEANGLSLSMWLLRHAPCPVFRLGDGTSTDTAAIRSILVPTDFSDCSQHAIHHALEWAALFGAKLTFLHAWHEALSLDAGLIPVAQQLRRREQKKDFYTAQLYTLIRRIAPTHTDFDVEVRPGKPASVIAEAAEAFDLVLMSTHGLTGWRLQRLGSVAEQVLQRTCKPVFLVKSFDRSLIPTSPASYEQPSFTSKIRNLFGDSPEAQSALPLFPAAQKPRPRPTLKRPFRTYSADGML